MQSGKWEVSDINNYRFALSAFLRLYGQDAADDRSTERPGRFDQLSRRKRHPGRLVSLQPFPIDQIFAELESGETSKADAVTMTFDPTYGYPSEVQVDRIKLAADDEFSLSISNFEILQ
jgi:hypothetical protein